MNSIAEATKSTINTIKVRALLSKALGSDAKPTPGYLFPEIASVTKTPGGSTIVLTQLLRIITPSRGHTNNTSASVYSSSNVNSNAASSAGSALASAYDANVHVILKAVKILRQLAQGGSVEFRMQMARQAKQPLADLVGFRGDWDEVHGDQFNSNIRQAAEELIEYMHAHPVQEHELAQQQQQQGIIEEDDNDEMEGKFLNIKENELLKSSTQGLPGFGNPEFEDSSSDGESDRADRVGRRSSKRASASGKARRREQRERTPPPEPPLPGFGNPAFDKNNPLHKQYHGGAGGRSGGEMSFMDRLVDRLQELTAPPPPMAMNAAKWQQEKRRQKLFVGEYSMADEANDNAPLGNIDQPLSTSSGAMAASKGLPGRTAASIMGTNPFRRFPRTPGQILGGWAEPGEGVTHAHKWNWATSPAVVESRHLISGKVYQLAQSIQTGYIRSSLSPSKRRTIAIGSSDGGQQVVPGGGEKSISGGVDNDSEEDEDDDVESEFVLWGTAKAICDSVLEGMAAEQSDSKMPNVPVITAVLRDLNDWIEHEDWDRRLKYLYVLDTLLAHPQTEKEVLGCSSISILMTTLDGPRCAGASQRSVSCLSAYLSQYIKQAESRSRQYSQTLLQSQNDQDLLVDV